MSGIWDLPTSLTVCDVEYPIRTDYRAILDILKYTSDPDYEEEASEIALRIGYPGFESMPEEHYEPALQELYRFIDMYEEDDGKRTQNLMDWDQDAMYIISAVNHVAGTEVRAEKYIHWWTFMGYYMEIGECTFSTIVSIRAKKAKHKKLDKWEQEYYRENKARIDIKKKYSEEDIAKQDKLNALLN